MRADSGDSAGHDRAGTGFATLKPVNGTAVMTTADADGIDCGCAVRCGAEEVAGAAGGGAEGKQARQRRIRFGCTMFSSA